MWIVCITSVRHVLTVNGYGGRQTKENEKSWCFKGWETLVIKLGAQGKKELAVAFKVTMAYVGQVLSGQKKGGKAPAIWEAAKKRNDSKLYNVDEIVKHETVKILDNKGNVKAERTN